MSESLFELEYHPGDEVVIRLKSPQNLLKGHMKGHGHLMAAQREMLLAIRDILDKAIEKTEPKPAEEKKPNRIEVQ